MLFCRQCPTMKAKVREDLFYVAVLVPAGHHRNQKHKHSNAISTSVVIVALAAAQVASEVSPRAMV